MTGQNTNIQVVSKPTDRRFIDIPDGSRFGRLTVIAFAGKPRKNEQNMWYCRCDCGSQILTRGTLLRCGKTQSCGCLNIEKTINTCKIHGASKTPEYSSYRNARLRCIDSKNNAYQRYGGRGIEFRFQSFKDFLNEVGYRPTPNHSIDRIDTNGHYEQGNVRWATIEDQCRNTRVNHFITVNSETKCITDWAKHCKLSHSAIHRRLQNGWCKTCAVTLPKKQSSCSHR